MLLQAALESAAEKVYPRFEDEDWAAMPYADELKVKGARLAHYFESDGWSIGEISLVPANLPYCWVQFYSDGLEAKLYSNACPRPLLTLASEHPPLTHP
jgi:hypothetical protein